MDEEWLDPLWAWSGELAEAQRDLQWLNPGIRHLLRSTQACSLGTRTLCAAQAYPPTCYVRTHWS